MRLGDLSVGRVLVLLAGGLLIMALYWLAERRPRRKKRYRDADPKEKAAYRLASTIDRTDR